MTAPMDRSCRFAATATVMSRTSRMFSSAIARIISSLLVKCRYTAPADSPDSVNRSCMDVEWKPSRRKQRRAASRI